MNTPVRFSKVLGLAIAFLFSSSILATEGITVVGKGAAGLLSLRKKHLVAF